MQNRAAARSARAAKIHSSVYERFQKDLQERWWEQKPTSTARLAAEVWEAIKGEDWVLAHGSLSGWERRLWEMTEASRCIAGGGGTGTGMGVALGVALAFRGTGKVCVSIQNDGDLLYTPGSLWTAAAHDIPMLVVMFNNRSYYQDVGHQTAITKIRQRPLDHVGVGVNLDRPATDFAMLARSFNLYGDGPILDAEAIRPALARGLKVVKEEKTARPHRHHYAGPVSRSPRSAGTGAPQALRRDRPLPRHGYDLLVAPGGGYSGSDRRANGPRRLVMTSQRLYGHHPPGPVRVLQHIHHNIGGEAMVKRSQGSCTLILWL